MEASPRTSFVIADAANDQFVPQAAWDGAQYLVTWIDYRNVPDLGQLRGDVFAARVDGTGVVLDPGGFPLTDGPLPKTTSTSQRSRARE